jgi:putative copper export protein
VNTDTAALIGAAARWLGFAATLIVLGAAGYRFGVLRAMRRAAIDLPGADSAAATTGLAGAIALLVVALPRLYGQALGFVDPGEPITRDLIATILGQTAWGRGWTTQVVAAGLATTGFVAARGLPRAGWMMAVAGASAVALAAPLTGHALAAERAGRWGYPLDVLHVLGAGVWLGTLAVMTVAGFGAARRLETDHRDRRIADQVRAFSPIALAGAGTVALAGLALAYRYLDGSLAALWTSSYGRTLFRKLVLLALVMAVGAWNWRVVTPRLGQPDGTARIRRSSLVELLLGTILLAITAVLVSTPMPGEE